MKKRFLVLSMVLTLILSLHVTAFAAEDTQESWYATFTAQEKMVDNFSKKAINDTFSGLQPGDERTFEVTIRNDHKDNTDWYMENDIVKTLEQATASAKAAGTGGYTYLLKYNDTEIFNSETVGGEGSEGLHGATDTLDEWFYLDSLKNGQTGKVTLTVGLDGETQGNAYQDTMAQLVLRFAVELNPEKPGTTTTTPNTPTSKAVKTGDETNLSPMIIMAAVSGLLLLLLGIYGVKSRRDEKKEVR